MNLGGSSDPGVSGERSRPASPAGSHPVPQVRRLSRGAPPRASFAPPVPSSPARGTIHPRGVLTVVFAGDSPQEWIVRRPPPPPPPLPPLEPHETPASPRRSWSREVPDLRSLTTPTGHTQRSVER